MAASTVGKRISSIGLTFSLLAVAIATMAPAAEAGHCAPHVGVAAPHNSGTWVSNSAPRWTWSASGCNVVRFGVSTSWGGYFETGSSAYQPSLGDGSYNIAVRTLYSYETYQCSWWWCYWQTHYAWTGFSGGPTVYIDTTAPSISHAVGQPQVAENGNLYLTSNTPITVAASDGLSGVSSLQWNLDGGAWNGFTGAFNVVGADGSHTVGYRATDRAGNVRAATFAVILDNTAPAMDVIHPTPNSANVNEFSVETCTDTIRVTQAGETVAETPSELPESPVPLPGTPPTPPLPEVELPEEPPATPPTPPLPVPAPEVPTAPEAPEAPEVLSSGPDACAGQVVETNDLTVIFPALPPEVPATPPLPVTPPALPPTPPMPPLPPMPALPPTPELPATPEPPASPVPLPEVPTVPEEATVDGQNVDFTPAILVSGETVFTVDVDDAIVGTKLVEFLVDGEVLDAQQGGDGTFTFAWDATDYSAGDHEFTIRSTDRLGNVGTLTFTVVVVPQSQAGVEATAAETQADAEAAAAQAQADAEAAAAQAQADAEAKIEELQNTQPPALPELPLP